MRTMIRTAVIVAIAALCAPVAWCQEGLPKLAIETYTLPNGLKVVLHRDTTVPQVTVAVAYHVGSKNERPGRTGFAHFFEHMMFRGTKHVPNYDVPLQETGAQSNAFTSEDMTVYFETVSPEYLERALYLEAERLGHLSEALNQEKFDTEREVVKNERRQRVENVPYGIVEENILVNVFPEGHPYSWSVIGSMQDLNASTLDDLRDFFAEFYHPGNAALVVAGDIDLAEAKRLVAKYFEPLLPGEPVKKVTAPPVEKVAKRVKVVDRVQYPRIYLVWPGVANDHADAPALAMLNAILSDSEASRLEKALIREARVATQVRSSSDSREIAGTIEISATAAAGTKLGTVEAELEKVLADLKRNPPTQSELDRVKAGYEKQSYDRLSSAFARAIALGIGLSQKGDAEYYRKEIERHLAVTLEDIHRVAAQYLTPEKLVIEVEPVAKGEAPGPIALASPKGTVAPVARAVASRVPKSGPDWSKLPGPAQEKAYTPPSIARRTLSNGIEVWVVRWDALPLVSASLSFPFGTADDPPGKEGLAELTAALLDQGTKRLSSVAFTEAVDALGANLGASVSGDETVVSLSVTRRNAEDLLELVREMLLEPRFDPADFEREKALQLAELQQGPTRPEWLAQRGFRKLLYGAEHPYGRPGDGTLESVRGLTLEDVRLFAAKHLTPAHSQLVIAGDVEATEVWSELERALGDWKVQGAVPGARPAPASKPEPGVVYVVDKPGAVQSVIRVGRLWKQRTDPGYLAAQLGNFIVGEDFRSRLNANLREKNGFTYGAGSRFQYRRDGSVWAAATSVRADATAPALREMLKELKGVQDERPLTDAELKTALAAVLREFPRAFATPGGLVGVVSEIARFQLPEDELATYQDRLRQTSPDEVRAQFRELVNPDGLFILIVGDREKIAPELQKLESLKEVRVLEVSQ